MRTLKFGKKNYYQVSTKLAVACPHALLSCMSGDVGEKRPLLPSGGKNDKDVSYIEEEPIGSSLDNSDTVSNGYLCCIPLKWIKRSSSSDDFVVDNFGLMILLLNSMIGSGIFVQPYVFKESGIVIASIEYVIIGLMTYAGVDLLIQSADVYKVHSYDQLALSALGQNGDKIVNITIFFGNGGALLSYILIIGSLSHELLVGWMGSHWYTNSALVTALLVAIFVTPPCLVRKFSHLTYISYASIFAVTATMLLVIFDGTLEAEDYDVNDDDSINLWSVNGSFRSIGSIVFAFGFASSVFHVYIAVDKSIRTPSNFSYVLRSTVAAGVTMCFLTGMVGYISFRSYTEENILNNFTGRLGAIFKIAVIMHLLFYIPGDFVVMRSSLFVLLGLDVSSESTKEFVAISISMLFAVTASACALNAFAADSDVLSLTLDVTGGLSGSLSNFILPGLIATFR